MAAQIPSNISASANLIKGHLLRIDLAVTCIKQEVIKLPKRATAAGRLLVTCIAETSIFRDEFSDFARIPSRAVKLLANLASVLEAVLEKVKHVAVISTGFRRFTMLESPESKIERYRRRVEDAVARLDPFIGLSDANQPKPSAPLQRDSSTTTSPPPPQDINPTSLTLPRWADVIAPARATLKVVAAVAPVIPVVGHFIQCGVDVGNGLLDMLDGMSENDEKAAALSERLAQLSDTIAVFQDKTHVYHASKPLLDCLERFQTQCNHIQEGVESLKRQARLSKFIWSQDNSGFLDKLNGKIDDALKALSLYLQSNAEHVQHIQERGRLLDRLGDGYFGDRRSSKAEGLCLEETRVEILQRIDMWSENPNTERVLWIKGQAGRGKSTIARTAISRFASKRKGPSAIFHFRRGNDTLNKRVILALARQLVRGEDERVTNAILQAIRDHQDVSQSPSDEQFKWLIAEPLQTLKNDLPPILFVIDAVDECGVEGLISTLLRSIHDSSSSLPPTVKFLITSRPEHRVIRTFDALRRDIEDLDKDDLEGTVIDRDLNAYYKSRLDQIEGLEDRWKGKEVVDTLVNRSQRLFLWAHTVMRYIEDSAAPQSRLSKVINNRSAFCGLDRLYTEILSEAFKSEEHPDPTLLELLQHVLALLAISPHPISLSVIHYLWSDSSDSTPSEVHGEVLVRLRSMLVVPDSPDAAIQFMHSSIREFLTDKKKCKDERFFVDAAVHHTRLSAICFDRMKQDLRPDICAFQDPSQTNDDVRDLVKEHISPGLTYCCRAWSAHLYGVVHGNPPNAGCTAVHGLLDGFCQRQLLRWLEVLSLTGFPLEAITMAEQGREWMEQRRGKCATKEDRNTSNLLHDVRMFSVNFRQPISFSARHISHSALVYCPRNTTLWKFYGSTNGPVIRVLRGPITQTWSNTLWVGRGHSHLIKSVAFSPDGKILASGSWDCTIRFWNPKSGMPIGEPLKGHSGMIHSLAFSRDGKILASGSADNTVRLWHGETGVPIGEPFEGHIGPVHCVAFSGDGRFLATGSEDWTIRLWNAESGVPIGEPMRGHSAPVRCLAFSGTEKTLASGSGDWTIRLWNPETGKTIGEPLRAHLGWVYTIAFSRDGKTLVSGSSDETIRLWNLESGMPIGEPLRNHSRRPVHSVVFSGDGKVLASGSADGTVRLRHPDSGTPIGEPLHGHFGIVHCVAFSEEGKTLASGSEDHTIRLWNAKPDSTNEQPLNGHSDLVLCMAFSDDGKILASGSSDNTVRLWNLETGAAFEEPLRGHSGSVYSLAFPGYRKMLASGSGDRTIRLWDVETGVAIGEPLQGHSDRISVMAFSSDGTKLFSVSWNESLTWKVSEAEHFIPNGQSAKRPLVNPNIRLYDHNDPCGRLGWVYRDNVPWFWMPEEFWMDGGFPSRILLSGHRIAISHKNIHILDVSGIM